MDRSYHGILIQARSGSTRYPGKCMAQLGHGLHHRSITAHVYRTADWVLPGQAWVIIPNGDDKMKESLLKDHIPESKIFFGDNDNLLKRHLDCAHANDITHIVRVTSDCPVLPIAELTYLVQFSLRNTEWDFITNLPYSTDGHEVEIISTRLLQTSMDMYGSDEHCTLNIKRNWASLAKLDFKLISHSGMHILPEWIPIKLSVDTS